MKIQETLNQISSEWDSKKNNGMFFDQSLNSEISVWWKCRHGHSWEASVSERLQGNGNCPICISSLHLKDPGYIFKDFLT